MNAKYGGEEDEAPEATQETDEYPWETDTSSGDTEEGENSNGQEED